MKKLLFLSLVLSGSLMQGTSFSYFLHALFDPLESIENKAEMYLRFYHKKNDTSNEYTNKDEEQTYYDGTNGTAGSFRKAFPLEDPTTLDKLSKMFLLKKSGNNSRLAWDPYSGQLNTYTIDYEKIWQQQRFKDRLWWTLRYRRPYIYGLSVLQCGTKIGVAAGVIYGAIKLAKWYKKRTNPTLHISA